MRFPIYVSMTLEGGLISFASAASRESGYTKNQDSSFIHWHTGEPLVSFQPSFSFTSK
jgi:hypothetical protein